MRISPKYFFNAWLGWGAGIFIFSLVFGGKAENLIVSLAVVWLLFIPIIHFVVLPKAKAEAMDKNKKM